MIEAGKSYFGAHEARRVVHEVRGDMVDFVHPANLRQETCSIAEFEAWMSGGAYRNYRGEDGDRRIRIRLGESDVDFVRPDAPGTVIRVKREDWDAWRATAV